MPSFLVAERMRGSQVEKDEVGRSMRNGNGSSTRLGAGIFCCHSLHKSVADSFV